MHSELPEASPQQLRDVLVSRLGLKTDQEVTAAVNFFNAATDLVMARSSDHQLMLKYSDKLIMIVSGCLTLLKEIADNPEKVSEQYETFSKNHLNGNGKK